MPNRTLIVNICSIVIISMALITVLPPSFGGESRTREPLHGGTPSSFSLLDVNGTSYLSQVKSQRGGTCWAHGTMSAMESNLMMTGLWEVIEGEGEPDLAEYHLDWWNGFNNHNNDDVETPEDEGIWVHQGGDYLMSTAYLSRGEGAVRDIDGQNYDDPPERTFNSYHEYTPMHVEWYTVNDPEGMDNIKRCIMKNGAMGTSMLSDGRFREEVNLTHYQPPSSDLDLNHAIAIVGWDDEMVTMAPEPGAWLVKNSWGSQWTFGTYFWISYYDKYAGRHPELGAVSFRNVSYLAFDKVYYHDYHGWRDTWVWSKEAFNSFTADRNEQLQGVSFFTTEDDVNFKVTVYDALVNGSLKKPLISVEGFEEKRGLHTHMFEEPIDLRGGDDFHIFLNVSDGGIAMDRTSKVPLLLEPSREPSFDGWINSTSAPNQSFYRDGENWKDLYSYNNTANFCIKGLVGHVSIGCPLTGDIIGPGSLLEGPISLQMDNVEARIDSGPPMNTMIKNGSWQIEGTSLDLEEGRHTLDITGYQDGCTEVTVSSRSEFIWEMTPPQSKIQIEGVRGNDSWYISPVNITMSAEDVGSGVDQIYYSLDQGPEMIYNGTFTVDSEGEHTLSFHASDRVGNIEVVHIEPFKIDLLAPSTNIDITGIVGDREWYTTDVQLGISGFPDTSGVDHIIYRVNEDPWVLKGMEGPSQPSTILSFQESGEYHIELYPVDTAGNRGKLITEEFDIDRLDPVVHIDLEGDPGENGWFRSPVIVNISVKEEHSGIADLDFRFLGGIWDDYTAPIHLLTEGDHTIQVVAEDMAGRSSEIAQREVLIDSSPPDTTLEVQGKMGENGWYVSNVTMELFSKDHISGTDIIEFSLDNGSFEVYAAPFIIDTTGGHSVQYRSRDIAGNIDDVGIFLFRLDLVDPWIRIRTPLLPVNHTTGTLPVVVEMGDLEDISPHAAWYLNSQEMGNLSNGDSIVLEFPNNGTYVLGLEVKDEAGRTSSLVHTFTYSIPEMNTIDENQDDGETEDGPVSGVYIISMVILILSALVAAIAVPLFIMFRRRGNPSPSSDGTDGSEEGGKVDLQGADGSGEFQGG